MSAKVHFLHSHVNCVPENLEVMTEEQGGSFHQDIKTMEKIPGMLEYSTSMLADYCWCLERGCWQ